MMKRRSFLQLASCTLLLRFKPVAKSPNHVEPLSIYSLLLAKPPNRVDPELVEHIKVHGILNPLVVINVNNNCYYEVVQGRHRLVAAYLAGLTKVPCGVLRLDN